MSTVLYTGNKNYSSWSIRGLLLARQAGLQCEEVVIPLDTPEGRARLQEISPTACVPCLHEDGLVIWDSLAIAEYLHDCFPAAGIWPETPAQRAIARSICAEMHSGFVALRTVLPMDIRSRYEIALPVTVQRDVQRIVAIWEGLRRRNTAAGPYLFGAWSAADAFLAPVVSRFRTYGVPLRGAAADYATAVWAWPAFAELVAAAEAEPWTLSPERLGIGGPKQDDELV